MKDLYTDEKESVHLLYNDPKTDSRVFHKEKIKTGYLAEDKERIYYQNHIQVGELGESTYFGGRSLLVNEIDKDG